MKFLTTIRKRWTGPLPKEENRLHLGPLGAADQVIDDATRIEEIQKNWRKLIGVEMETYGVYRACYESPDPKPRVVSFKAVCDFAAEKADPGKNTPLLSLRNLPSSFLKRSGDLYGPRPRKGDTKMSTHSEPDQEILAITTVYAALKELDAGAQKRVVEYVLKKLISRSTFLGTIRERDLNEPPADSISKPKRRYR